MKVRILTVTLYILATISAGILAACASDGEPGAPPPPTTAAAEPTSHDQTVPPSTFITKTDDYFVDYELVTIEGMDCITVISRTADEKEVRSITCDWDSKEE